MSFQEDVFKAVKRIHLPASSNAIWMSMSDHDTISKMSASAGREKVRKALYALQHDRKILTSAHNDAGVLVYSLAAPMISKPEPEVKVSIPNKETVAALNETQEDFRSIMKDLCLSLSAAFHHAYTRL